MVLPNEGPRFCLIENTTNLSISPSQDVLSGGHDYVNISCNITSAKIGFWFFNVTNLAISSIVFHMCGGYPSVEVVKYVNGTDQFLYYDGSVPMVLFFSHCYNIKLLNITMSVDIFEYSMLQGFVVGVNLCGDSEIKSILPDSISEEEEDTLTLTMFVYFTDTALLLPKMRCNLNITSNSLFMTLDPIPELNLRRDRVRVDSYGDFILFLTQSFVVNVDLYISAPVVKVVFVNSDTASRVNFQGYDRPYKVCANSNISENSTFFSINLQVLFYETSDFVSNVTDILHPMRIHDTAFTVALPLINVLNVQKLTGKLSHQVSLHNVSWCTFFLEGYLLAQNLAKPCIEPVGDLYLSLKNIVISGMYTDDTSIKTSQCLMCFSHIKRISMTGVNYFAENTGGTVIKLVASELAVSGNLTIMDGHAREGGAISMDTSSTLVFEEPLIAGFYHNIADQGSAIYSPIESNDYNGESNVQIRPGKKYSLYNVTSINISLYFSNNTDGVVHNSFYAPLFSYIGNQTSPNLLFSQDTWDSDRFQYAYTTLIDTILHMDRMDKYTSLTNGLCIRVPGKDWECTYLDRETVDWPCPRDNLISTCSLSRTNCILSSICRQSALRC